METNWLWVKNLKKLRFEYLCGPSRHTIYCESKLVEGKMKRVLLILFMIILLSSCCMYRDIEGNIKVSAFTSEEFND